MNIFMTGKSPKMSFKSQYKPNNKLYMLQVPSGSKVILCPQKKLLHSYTPLMSKEILIQSSTIFLDTSEFRPISCCNIVYKCMTQVPVNRLEGCLEEFVSNIQTAFVPGRNIAENVLLAQECIKNYPREVGQARCSIKVDLMKAYDCWLEFCISLFNCY